MSWAVLMPVKGVLIISIPGAVGPRPSVPLPVPWTSHRPFPLHLHQLLWVKAALPQDDLTFLASKVALVLDTGEGPWGSLSAHHLIDKLGDPRAP